MTERRIVDNPPPLGPPLTAENVAVAAVRVKVNAVIQRVSPHHYTITYVYAAVEFENDGLTRYTQMKVSDEVRLAGSSQHGDVDSIVRYIARERGYDVQETTYLPPSSSSPPA